MSATTPRRSLWIPWVFVGGMLLVVAVNGALVVAALSTFTGVTVGGAYDRGRAYNHVLEEAARQDALAWRATVALAAGTLRVAVRDRDGAPVAGDLRGLLVRPQDGAEAPLLFEAAGPGAWQAAAAPRAGLWEARLRLTDAAGNRRDIRQRLVAP